MNDYELQEMALDGAQYVRLIGGVWYVWCGGHTVNSYNRDWVAISAGTIGGAEKPDLDKVAVQIVEWAEDGTLEQ